MKIRWKYCLAALLGVLGFSSCDPDDPIGGWGRAEYGQPHANYKVLGEVKDPAGKPIQGIRVVVDPGSAHPDYYKDTLYTDVKGHFEKDLPDFMWDETSIVKFEDVDGADNGSFKTKELKASDLSVKQDKKGDNRWYDGDFTITANTQLEKDE